MVRLPAEVRETLIENIDNYLQSGSDQDPEVVAEFVIGAIEAAADEHSVQNRDGVISALETSGELESSLEEVLQEFLENKEAGEFASDEVVALIERICEIEWVTAEDVDDDDDDEAGSGFFDDESGMFEDDE